MLISTMRETYFQSYSRSESLQNAPISFSLWYWVSSEFLRSSCSCRPRSSPSNSVQDEWLLSLTKTNNPRIITFDFIASIAMLRDPLWLKLLLQMLENFRKVLMILDPHVMKLLCVHRPHQFPGACRARRFIPVFPCPGVCLLSFLVASLENIRLDLCLGSASVSWC